jgi:hypothetical protein
VLTVILLTSCLHRRALFPDIIRCLDFTKQCNATLYTRDYNVQYVSAPAILVLGRICLSVRIHKI